MGYDKTCETNSCTGKFMSVNGVDLLPFNEYNTAIKMKTGRLSGKEDVLLLSGAHLAPSIWRKSIITGVACGDNQPTEFLKVGCEDDLNSIRNYVYNSTFLINCNETCGNSKKEVFGDDPYDAESSLCKAGSHANVLTKTPMG